MEKYKAIIYYGDENPLTLAEIMTNVADGEESDTEFDGSPASPTKLRDKSLELQDKHRADVDGGEIEHVAFIAIHEECVEIMYTVGVWANYKCAGSAIKLANLKIPYYDSTKAGRDKSNFSLVNGEKPGELVITVPVKKRHESYIVVYSFDIDTPISDYKVAGGSNRCKFSLFNLPIGYKIYVCWASIGAKGLSQFSVPHPIIVT